VGDCGVTVIVAKRADLASVLRHGIAVLEKGGIPVLNNVRIAVARGRADLTFTDMSLWFSASIAAEADAITATTLPAALLRGAVESMEGADFRIEVTGPRAVASSGRARLRMPTEPADGFPGQVDSFDGSEAIVPLGELARAINVVSYATPVGHSKYAEGVLFDFVSGDLNLAAYDGVRLAHDCLPNAGADDRSFTLPLKASRVLAKLCAESGVGEVAIATTDRKARFRHGDWTLTSALIEIGAAPYAQVINDRPGDAVLFDPRELDRALARLAIVADQYSQGVKLVIEADKITVSLVNAKSSADGVEEVPAAYEGAPQEVGYNLAYLRAALRSIPGDDAEMFIGSPVRRAVIASRDGAGGTHLIGPYQV
jgi:DNA polymerase-3 subunit beta